LVVFAVSVLTAVVLLVSGCRDNPENKTAKQARSSTQKALTIAEQQGDLAKAQKEIQAATKEKGKSLTAEAVALTSGKLKLDQAEKLRSSLDEYADHTGRTLDKLAIKVSRISEVAVQRTRIEDIRKADQLQIKLLDEVLFGDQEQLGLNRKLNDKQAVLDDLYQQKEQLHQQAAKALAQADNIQQKADDKLRQGQLATGNKAAQLQTQGYNLLLDKKKYSVKAQTALDEAKILANQIAIIEPQVEKFQADIESVQQRIYNLKDPGKKKQLTQQLSDIDKQIDSCQDQGSELIAVAKNTQKTYDEKATKSISLFEDAIKDFKKVRSKTTGGLGKAYIGDCHLAIASAAIDDMQAKQYLALRLQSLTDATQGKTTQTLGDMADEYQQSAELSRQKAMENLDLAIETYSGVRLGGKDDSFADNIVKSQLLALHQKMLLAEQAGEYDLADEIMQQIDPLKVEAEKYDPAFENSLTARILNEDLNFVPAMPVDQTAYYEELKRQFQDWKRLPIPDQEPEVDRLLAMLDEMPAPRDPQEFDRIIGPERQQLEKALKRGFEATAIETDTSTDPNYYDY